MNKIVSPEKAEEISRKIRKKNKIIVVAGGCFDILHIGHIKFLEKAKKQGDSLFILLESDNNVKKLKGTGRPINNQKDRAQILAAISYIDYVVTLNDIKLNKDYDDLIYKLSPNVIAIVKNDPQEIHSKRQIKKIKAKIVYINKVKNKSTSKLAKTIFNNFN